MMTAFHTCRLRITLTRLTCQWMAFVSTLLLLIISTRRRISITDPTRFLGMDLSQMTCKCGGRCVLCGREHIPGKTSANTADRLVSDFRVYDDRWVISLCADCNYLKFTADPGEFLDKSIRIVRNRLSLYHLCDLARLVGQEPDYNIVIEYNRSVERWYSKHNHDICSYIIYESPMHFLDTVSSEQTIFPVHKTTIPFFIFLTLFLV
jgi:hypothetical protein